MKYIAVCGLPVPKTYAWDSGMNTIDAGYSIMEKVYRLLFPFTVLDINPLLARFLAALLILCGLGCRIRIRRRLSLKLCSILLRFKCNSTRQDPLYLLTYPIHFTWVQSSLINSWDRFLLYEPKFSLLNLNAVIILMPMLH